MANKSAVANYFNRPSWILVVIIGFILGIGIFASNWFIALVIIGLSGWIAKTKLIDSMTDEQIEEQYKLFAEANFETAKRDCGIDDSMLTQSPDWFWYIDDFKGNHKRLYRIGKDKVNRCNTRGICILNYGRDQIFSWAIAVNIQTEKTSNEDTSEYYYKDVVGIDIIQKETLVLRTAGGLVKYMIAGKVNSESNKKGGKEAGAEERGKAVISSIRTMLREKKS